MSFQDRLALKVAIDVLNERATEELASYGHTRPETNRARVALTEVLRAETQPRLVASKQTGGT